MSSLSMGAAKRLILTNVNIRSAQKSLNSYWSKWDNQTEREEQGSRTTNGKQMLLQVGTHDAFIIIYFEQIFFASLFSLSAWNQGLNTKIQTGYKSVHWQNLKVVHDDETQKIKYWWDSVSYVNVMIPLFWSSL